LMINPKNMEADCDNGPNCAIIATVVTQPKERMILS